MPGGGERETGINKGKTDFQGSEVILYDTVVMVKWGIAFVKTCRVYRTFNVSKLRGVGNRKQRYPRKQCGLGQEYVILFTNVWSTSVRGLRAEVLKKVTLEIRNICKIEGKRTSPKHYTLDKGDTA